MVNFWMELSATAMVFAFLGYFLVGQLFMLNYILLFKPPERSVWLGFESLLWPFSMLLDFVMGATTRLAAKGRGIADRTQKKEQVGEL